MSHRVAYYRVSTADQSIEAQRAAMGGPFDQEFKDEGVSGGIVAAQRPGFAAMLSSLRKGDAVHVYAVDRLGRDALDVQANLSWPFWRRWQRWSAAGSSRGLRLGGMPHALRSRQQARPIEERTALAARLLLMRRQWQAGGSQTARASMLRQLISASRRPQ